MKQTTLLILFWTFLIHITNSQITSVNYLLDYNEDTHLYEVKLQVESGTAGWVSERIAFFESTSFVVPTGKSLEVVDSYMPLYDNATYQGEIAANWNIVFTEISPPEQAENDFYSIHLEIGETSYYNNLNPGDEVLLFTFSVTGTYACSEEVRFYDPSIDFDFNGQDWFGHGFLIGSGNSVHNENIDITTATISFEEPEIYACENECVTLIPTTNFCVNQSYTYLWSTGESSKYIEVCPTESTTYTVTLVDNDGNFVYSDSIRVVLPEEGGVSKVKLLIDYNESSEFYDVSVYIECGHAITYPERIQFNTQITVVTPTGSIVSMAELHNPKVDNQFYTGTVPAIWDFGPKSIAPPTQPDLDFHTVFPNLSPIGAFNNLYEGDTVKLFSLEVQGPNPCKNEVRLFENGQDLLNGYDPSGGNYEIGYTMGLGVPIYAGNLYATYEPNYIVSDNAISICAGSCIDLNPTFNCLEGVTQYEWSTGETTPNILVCPEEQTNYYLLLKDENNIVTDSLFATINPDSTLLTASANEVCGGESVILYSCSGNGTWSQSSTNPFGANLTPLPGGLAEVTFLDNLVESTHEFVYAYQNQVDTLQIQVNGNADITLNEIQVCLGASTNVQASRDGMWSSNDESVAIINPYTGGITTVGEGSVSFSFTTFKGCTSQSGEIFVASSIETEFLGPSVICVGETSAVLANINGTWESSNPEIATITQEGEILGISNGTAFLTFRADDSDCISVPLEVTVDNPSISFTNSTSLCVGQTTTITPQNGGSWTSSDPTVATITNSGLITAVAPGSATFTFTDNTTLCVSDPSELLLVSNTPTLSIENDDICVNETTQLISNVEGTWASTDPSIATVNTHTGLVTGVDVGIVYFVFTNLEGCNVNTSEISVSPLVETGFNGPSTICPFEVTSVFPNTGGTWVSSNPAVATVDNAGNVTGLSSGSATLIFNSSIGSCDGEPLTVIVGNGGPPPNVSQNGPLCEGDDLNLVTEVIPGATYFWYGPGGFVSTDQNPTVVNALPNQSGEYCLIVSVDGCQSSESCTDVLIRPTPATPMAFSNSPLCEGYNLELSTNAVAGATYQWVGPNGFTSSNQNPVISQMTASDAGQYCLYVTVDGCESNPTCTDVVVNFTPATPEIITNSPICKGGELQLSTPSVQNATYKWIGPNGFISSDQSPIIEEVTEFDSGTYCLQITVNGCESNTSCKEVEVIAIPWEWSAGSNPPNCEGGELKLDAEYDGDAIYTWTGPNNFFSNEQNPIIENATIIDNGEYCVYITVDGCDSPSFCFDVYINPLPIIDTIGNNGPICEGDTLKLFTNEIEGATYKWYGPGLVSSDVNPVITDTSLIRSGNYRVRVDLNGCKSEEITDVIVIPQDSLPVILTDTAICSGEDLILQTLELPNAIYEWIGPNGFQSSIFNPVIPNATSAVSGEYTLRVIDLDSTCPNDGFSTINIEVNSCIEPSTTCDQIDPSNIICDYNDFTDISGSLSPENTGGNQPEGNLCEDGDPAYNPVWYGFVALEGDYEIIVQTTNCVIENNIRGAQVGVYSSCDFTDDNKIYCAAQLKKNNEFRISSDLFEKGNVYYLFIDGVNLSVCDYSISVEGFYDNTVCTELSKVTGIAYIDANENGIYDDGETPLRNAMISLTPGNFSVLTNDEGRYIINTPKGGATLTAKMNDGYWIINPIIIEDFTIFEDCVEDVNFGFIPNLFYQEAKLSVANSIVRCDWETRFYFTVENTGNIEINPTVEFTFDNRASYFDTDLMNLQVNANTAVANLEVLQPFEVKHFEITLKMPSGSINLPTLTFNSTLFSESGEEMDTFVQNEQLRCSYDPNDKLTFPDREGDENLTLMDEEIEYTIRFQNNGNDTAFQVKIIDPLDADIDPTSIRVINSSHQVETCIENDNLIFLFENINLVDSTTNYDQSQGFVSYRCDTKGDRAEFTPVHNTADIFFDTNLPIVTNTTLNTLVSELCTDVMTELNVSICEGEEYMGLDQTGTYIQTFTLPYGCDSIVTLNLDVQGITYSSQEVYICEGESIVINNQEYTFNESQELSDTLYNDNGCITNVLHFEIEVYPTIEIAIDTTICEGYDYFGYTESGTYTIDSFDVFTGCDITTTIDLEVLPLNDPSCLVSTFEIEDTQVILYPNPADELFYLESNFPIDQLELLSIASVKVNALKSTRLEENTYQVSTGNLVPGVYILRVKIKENHTYKKLIINR